PWPPFVDDLLGLGDRKFDSVVPSRMALGVDEAVFPPLASHLLFDNTSGLVLAVAAKRRGADAMPFVFDRLTCAVVVASAATRQSLPQRFEQRHREPSLDAAPGDWIFWCGYRFDLWLVSMTDRAPRYRGSAPSETPKSSPRSAQRRRPHEPTCLQRLAGESAGLMVV